MLSKNTQIYTISSYPIFPKKIQFSLSLFPNKIDICISIFAFSLNTKSLE